jgi:hypothetical protein
LNLLQPTFGFLKELRFAIRALDGCGQLRKVPSLLRNFVIKVDLVPKVSNHWAMVPECRAVNQLQAKGTPIPNSNFADMWQETSRNQDIVNTRGMVGAMKRFATSVPVVSVGCCQMMLQHELV